jgi:hypothetical protein
MSVPIIYLAARLRQFCERLRDSGRIAQVSVAYEKAILGNQ